MICVPALSACVPDIWNVKKPLESMRVPYVPYVPAFLARTHVRIKNAAMQYMFFSRAWVFHLVRLEQMERNCFYYSFFCSCVPDIWNAGISAGTLA